MIGFRRWGDFCADFADDGVDGADCDVVYRVLEKEIALWPEYGLRNNYDKMVVYPLAGDRFTGDVSKFIELGIRIDYSGKRQIHAGAYRRINRVHQGVGQTEDGHH